MLEEIFGRFSDMTVYFFLAVPASMLFLIRLTMAMFGADGGDNDAEDPGHHHDDSTGAFKMFSILSITSFFMAAGWMGLASRLSWDLGPAASALLAVGFGTSVLFLTSGLSYGLKRLSNAPVYDNKDCLGTTGKVYLRIPPKGQGRGQVQVSVQGRQRILSAISVGPEIQAFTAVKIITVGDDDSVVVEPKD